VSYVGVPSGPGVRWDSGIETGSDVGLFYDAMLAKLIVWAPSRDAAIARMRRALLDLTIDGVETSRDFHLRVMNDAEFQRGDIDIQWLERRLPSLLAVEPAASLVADAAVIAALIADHDRAHPRRTGGDRPTDRPRTDTPANLAWQRAARLDALR
jgi:acetyl-CoA carboxylase biotin carboxylase subunit